MSEKILTVIIPAYNAQDYLKICLDSLTIHDEFLRYLDVIVVNDGSTDTTGEIAEDFCKKFPDSISCIHKANAGHGSCINVGLECAKGKYLKVLDADDVMAEQGLLEMLSLMQKTCVDVVVSNFDTVNYTTQRKTHYYNKSVQADRVYNIQEYLFFPLSARTCLTFHGLFYCTAFYRSCNLLLSQRVFYEDHEYATLPFIQAQTILWKNVSVYQYLIGNANQSVSDQNQIKRSGDLKQVFMRIFNEYERNKNELIEGKKDYFIFKLAKIATAYFSVMLIKNSDRQAKTEAKKMFQMIRAKDHLLFKRVNRYYKIAKFIGRVPFGICIFHHFKNTKIYQKLRFRAG